MSEPDLVLLVARCFQDFMDVENYDPNTCYVPPSLETLDDRAKQNYLNNALFRRKVDTVVYVVNEHIAALLAQVAELQRQLSSEQEAHAATIKREAKLSLQLSAYEEAARPEPVGVVLTKPFGKDTNDMCILQWADNYRPKQGDRLYSAPVNTAAFIEQARVEEREAVKSILLSLYDSITDIDDLVYEFVDAIRARKP